ncbi:pentatricopeptide repeat-containing protein mitochondrial-like isoform X1 [Gossypium australe]|uniref:Pentatricopeptide repeat-containing protein mitochondrial-like isoform X1 n=1 Tax=Gossypium australe TaxID=47621 RepID=A0A5B6WFY5_9ROSI|nr:pentatricopeptide repeat-containing protein mitochondrial-like isoform X1 [Gossypium australe]
MMDNNISLDIDSYDILIDAHCKYGKNSKAIDTIDTMKKQGIEPDVVTYNILADAHCREGMVFEALDTVDTMIKQKDRRNNGKTLSRNIPKGPIPDTVTYNTLTQGMCQLGRVSSARELLRKMLAFGQVPNVVTCLNLLNGLCKSDRLEEALELFRAMWNSSYADFAFWVKLIFCQSPWRRTITMLMHREWKVHVRFTPRETADILGNKGLSQQKKLWII